MTSTLTLFYTYGLPASGKTTHARDLVKKVPRTVRANLDDIRLMLHEGRWSKSNEKAAVLVQNAMILAALKDGRSVICDDTNLSPRAKDRLANLAQEFGAHLQRINFSDVPLGECIKRDAARGQAGNRSVGEDVIRGMYDRYLKPPKRRSNGNPDACLVDLDGSLCWHNSGRGPFEWTRVGEDDINPMLALVIESLRTKGFKIVIMSGRDAVCRPETEDWLLHNNIQYDNIFMRPEGDTRPDDIVKKELLEQTEHFYNPVLVFDDRQKVVDMWRDQGIECWQLDQGRF